MSNDFQVPPPSYSEVVDKAGPAFTAERAAMYTVHQQGNAGEIKYSTITPNIPAAYGVQVVPLVTFARTPIQCTCANCRSMIITRVEQKSGLFAWLLCLLILIFGCWLGCCLIPFCIPDLQNVQHYCPNCSAFIGEYRPL